MLYMYVIVTRSNTLVSIPLSLSVVLTTTQNCDTHFVACHTCHALRGTSWVECYCCRPLLFLSEYFLTFVWLMWLMFQGVKVERDLEVMA